MFLFFLPMVFIKALGMGSSDIIAIVMTCICLLFSLLSFNRIKLTKKEKSFWIPMIILGFILILTSGKYFILLSIYSLFLLSKMNSDKIRKVLLYVCAVAVIILIVVNISSSSVEARFINGAWTYVTKRSNTIFVSFFMLFNLYIMQRKPKKLTMILFVVAGFLLFKFTYSRSGFVCILLECLLLFAYSFKPFQKSRTIKAIVILSPILIYAICFLANYLLGTVPILDKINMLLQNRLTHGKRFLSLYPLTLFGQHVVTSSTADSYMILDNTYLNLYTNYGLVLSILWVALNIGTLSYLYKKENYIGIIVVVSYLFYGITESFVLVSFINAGFFYFGEYLASKIARKEVYNQYGYTLNESVNSRLRKMPLGLRGK